MQNEPTSSDLYRTSSGDYLAREDEGDEVMTLPPGNPPPSGWHLMTKAEFERDVDPVTPEFAAWAREKGIDLDGRESAVDETEED